MAIKSQPGTPNDPGLRCRGWVMAPAGLRGIVNDAVAIYFLDATSAAAFVSRWCAGSKVENQRQGIPGARGSAGVTGSSQVAQDDVLTRRVWQPASGSWSDPSIAAITRSPDPAEMAERYGAEHRGLDARLVCGQCGSRRVDMVVSGTERRQ
jgi:hypothetical protein